LKSTGIVRKVDELGRIVLPKELRVILNINEKDPLEIFVDEENRIILKKYEPACIFCNGMNGIINYKGYNVCRDCMEKLSGKLKEQKDED
jgi:AbrB family transcriptional regulator, transcriptional pleiotropic regulator of transition state genes